MSDVSLPRVPIDDGPSKSAPPDRLEGVGASRTSVGWPERAALAAILALAATVAWWDPGLYLVTMDTAEMSNVGRDIASGSYLPLAGRNVASGDGGRWTGPLAYYLTALPFFIDARMEFAAVFFGLGTVIATLLLWRTARLLFNPTVGLAAAALYAASAQVTYEQRVNLFVPLAPLLTLALVHACAAWGARARPAMVIPVIVLAGALTQLHVVHAAFVTMIAVTWWAFRLHVDRTKAGIGALIVLGMQLPWAVEQILTDGRDIVRMFEWLASRGEGTSSSMSAARSLRTLGAAVAAPFQIPLDLLTAQGGRASTITRAAFIALGLVTAVGVGVALRRREWRRGAWLVAAWLMPLYALVLLGAKGVYSFHLISALPGLALLAALGIEGLSRAFGRARPWVVGGAVIALAIPQVALLAEVGVRVAARDRARLPMSAVLSFPDEMWRFPVAIEFPTLRAVEQVRSLLTDVGLRPDAPGRVHGPEALELSHYPPLLPVLSCQGPGAVVGAGSHWVLGRDRACGAVASSRRRGRYCLRDLARSDLIKGWQLHTADGVRETGFPLDLREGLVVSRSLGPADSFDLILWTSGPAVAHLDRPIPPAVEVTVDGAPLRPWQTRTYASLWVEVERRFRVRVHTASIVEVRVLAGGARGDIVIAPAGDQP